MYTHVNLISTVNHPLKVCAFNVQVFGKTKFSNSDVVNILIKVSYSVANIIMYNIRLQLVYRLRSSSPVTVIT